MPTESVDIIFKGDPSDAVNAAKKVTEETNKIDMSGHETNKTFDKLHDRFQSLSSRLLKAAGTAFLLKKAIDGLNVFKEHVDQAEKLSRAIETSYVNAQELILAEKQAGLSAGTIQSAIEGIARAQAQGIISPDLLNLGLSFDEIKEKNPAQLFDILSKRLHEGQLSTLQFEAAMNVLGEQGGSVALKLSSNFEDLRKMVHESGRIIEEETFARLIEQSDVAIGRIQTLGEEILKLVTPFETFGEAMTKTLGFVSEQIENAAFGFRYIREFYANRFSGMNRFEADDAALVSALGVQSRARQLTQASNISRAATENLTEERASGAVDLLDFLRGRIDSTVSEISSLQRVGLAATGGESESIRLQRRQLVKADSIINELIKQTNVIGTTL